MKSIFSCIVLLSLLTFKERPLEGRPLEERIPDHAPPGPSTENLFIITLDGFRWQEVFEGAAQSLLADEHYTPDASTISLLYGGESAEKRRARLLPFFWTVIAKQGQLYGNRAYDNKVNVENIYALSYPGYNEIFTGNTDITVSSNHKTYNHNINVLEYLDSRAGFEGKVAAFTSWDVFPYIFNRDRNKIVLNSGYSQDNRREMNIEEELIRKVSDQAFAEKTATRHDQLTFLTAKEYIRKGTPRVVFLGLGETDEAAHAGRYDTYLQKATEADRMIAELWHWVQTTPGYKNNTTFLITTDHGRGSSSDKWGSHGVFVRGSSQTWLAVLGPGIQPLGEIKADQQLYQKQMAQTIAHLLGEVFTASQPVAKAISLRN